jgi:chromosome segregation protein
MKLEFVEITGFRGFRDKARFDFPAGFVVFTGRNGAGKSTVLDAVDFAVTGTINKFAVKTARGGGLEEHVWWVGSGRAAEHYVTVGFSDGVGATFTITRSRDRGLQASVDDPFKKLCTTALSTTPSVETLMQTTLIRDESIVALSVDLPEQQRFAAVRAAIGGLVGPDHSRRTGEILRAANLAEDEQQRRMQNAQTELGRALSELTEARSAAERSPDLSEAMRTIANANVALPPEPRARSEALRRHIALKRQVLQQLEAVRLNSETLAPELAYLHTPDAARALEAAQAASESARQQKERADHLLGAAERADAAEKEGDTYAAHVAAIIEHGQQIGLQEGHCPLCAADRKPEEFADAIADARKRLASRGDRLAASARAVNDARAGAELARARLSEAISQLAAETERRLVAEQRLNAIRRTYSEHGFQGSPESPEEAQRLILAEQERLTRLERALYILEASSAVDRVGTLEAKVAELRQRVDAETTKVESARRAAQAAKQIDTSSQTVANQILTEQFDTVMPLLKELYRRLRPHAAWTEIDSDFGGRVRASLNFTVGDGHNIQFLFSSGQRRAAGLAFLLAIHLSRQWCGWKSLLLDDPVQHIDDYRALNLVEVLAAIRRSGRQVIIAVEDSALADLLCRRLRSTIGELGRRFDLQTSKAGSAEVAAAQDIYPMPRAVLRPAQAS